MLQFDLPAFLPSFVPSLAFAVHIVVLSFHSRRMYDRRLLLLLLLLMWMENEMEKKSFS